MKRQVTVNGQAVELEVIGSGTVRFAHRGVGETEVAGLASVLEVEPGVYSVLWGSRSFEAKVLLDAGKGVVDIGADHFRVEVVDPRELSSSAAAGAGTGRQEIAAPMPGRVVRVLVEEGQQVEAGQGIVVVEAMKMQNEMQSPKQGTVVSVRAKEGEAVAAAEVLAVVE